MRILRKHYIHVDLSVTDPVPTNDYLQFRLFLLMRQQLVIEWFTRYSRALIRRKHLRQDTFHCRFSWTGINRSNDLCGTIGIIDMLSPAHSFAVAHTVAVKLYGHGEKRPERIYWQWTLESHKSKSQFSVNKVAEFKQTYTRNNTVKRQKIRITRCT